MSSPVKMQGYISFPRQKLPDSKKDDNWLKRIWTLQSIY